MAKAFRKSPIKLDLSGLPEVAAVLAELGRNHGDSVERRLARSAIGAGLRQTAKAIKAAAPAKTRIKLSVGTRFKKNRRSGIHEAKAGLNVGNKSGTAPHAHFFVLGTRERKNKAGKNLGRVDAHYFVREAVGANRQTVVDAMLRQIQIRLPIEVAKAKAKVT